MFSKILVPLDESTLAEQSLGTAAAIARGSGGTISLVLAAEGPEENIYLSHVSDELSRGAGVVVDATVAHGRPADVICGRANEIGADLIVMTSHGRTGLSRLWMGSVADGVVRHASVPVLIVRPREAYLHPSNEARLFHRIMVPLDGSSASCAVLPSAVDLARASNAVLVLVRVVQPMPLYVFEAGLPAYPGVLVDPEQTNLLAASAREELTDLATSLERDGMHVESEVLVADSVATALLDLARARSADLIAMTTHGRGMSRLIVGSVADKLIRGSELPLLLFRPNAVGARLPENPDYAEASPVGASP